MKITLLFALSAISSLLIAQVPTASLSAYYPFNGNTNDYAGTRHGTPAGTAQYGVDRWGNTNGCYDVIGNSNHIMLPNDYWVKGDYSVSAWVKVKQVESYPRLYDFGNGYAIDNALGKLSHGGNGKPSLEYCATTTSNSSYFTNTYLTIGAWYHLVFITAGNQQKMYINNVLTGTYTASLTPQNVFRTKNKIGGSNAPLQDDTNAFIDDFRLYDRAITPQEVDELFNESNIPVALYEVKQTIDQLYVYPNPATNELSVNFVSRANEKTKVQLFDNLGRLMYDQQLEPITGSNDMKVPTGNLSGGFYYITISNASGTQSIKFVKE